MDEKARKKERKEVEVMKNNVTDDKEVQFLDDNQENKKKKRKKNDSSLNGMQELSFSKPGKKKRKDNGLKKNEGEESQHGECNEFKSNVEKDDCQYKKEEKKRKKKKKQSEESKSKVYNEFESNEGGVDDQGKKMKKKKTLSEESKNKVNNEYESNKGQDDGQGKMKKKKLRDKSKNKESGEFNSVEGDPSSVRSRDGNAQSIVTEVDSQSKKMKTRKKAKPDTGESPNTAHNGSSKPKRVTFSDQVEVCCDGLVRGKRYTPEEDEKIKKAVFDYIESHGLGDDGLDMVLHCISHREIRNCWKDIGAAALPERPYVSVYGRAHILFEGDQSRKWTPEELDFLRKMKEHGCDWKSIAESLGKHRIHVKDAWRRIKSTQIRTGRWTQEEYQKLFDLVNQDLRVRASQDFRKVRHGMLRDNIGWEAIGDTLVTRNSQGCCHKWYDQLTSPMVANGVWNDIDDYHLVNALLTLDACCFDEVDWDNLLEHRPGDICRKRWNQMVQCIGEHGRKSFAEQVEILGKRYCPDFLEAREAFDAKPVVC